MTMIVELRDVTVDDFSVIMVDLQRCGREYDDNLESHREWFAVRKSRSFPVIVAMLGGKVPATLSMATGAPLMVIATCVSIPVYVHQDVAVTISAGGWCRHSSTIVSCNDVHVLISAIEAGNTASIRLRESLGQGVWPVFGSRHQVQLLAGPDLHGVEALSREWDRHLEKMSHPQSVTLALSRVQCDDHVSIYVLE